MPIIPSSAYGSAEGVLNLARALVNDARVPGGNVLTDGSPFAFQFLNSAFDDIQFDLANSGVETFVKYVWLLALPTVPSVDPATRVFIDDTGVHIRTATGVGNSDAATPILPVDLLIPLLVWERANGSTDYPREIKIPKEGIRPCFQGGVLNQWEWATDQLIFLGATQSRDVLLKYDSHFTPMVLPTDPVPIRGVQNAAAFFVAAMFAASRGSPVAKQFAAQGTEALDQFKNRTARRKQRTSHRRRPYSYRNRFSRGNSIDAY